MTTSKYQQYVRNTDQWINYSFINYQLNLLKKFKKQLSKKWVFLDHTQAYADIKIYNCRDISAYYATQNS